jgi:glyoxylase-like metal-dependent hydrolase (beta-lactamase superfamily II)
MRRTLGIAVAALVGLVWVGVPYGQQSLTPQPMQVEQVRDSLYVIRGPFNPCAPNGCGPRSVDDGLLHEAGDVAVLVTSEGVVLVDDKFARHVPDIMDSVRGLTSQPVKYLLNTHHHMDHAGGNETMVDLIEIIAHRNVRENFIRNGQPGAPRVVFSEQAEVHLGGAEVQARYLGRGHTNGDAVVVFPSLRVIHSGDLVIDGMPVIDYDNGGSALEFVDTLDRLLDIDFDLIIPGHGRLLTKDDARVYRENMAGMNRRMFELVDEGVSRDQVAGRLDLSEFGWDHTVSTGTFMASVERYYDEVVDSTR